MVKNERSPRPLGESTLLRRILARWQLYLLLILPLAWLILFCYTPMTGLVLAFKKYNAGKGVWGSPWVGLANFQNFFSSYKSSMVIKNTLVLSLYSLLVGFPIPILFALLLNVLPGKRYKKTIQTVTYVPYFFSTVIMVGLLFQLLDYRIGLYGTLYRLITGEVAPNILASGTNFKHIYVWSGIWQSTGYNAIIYIAALSTADMALHEAAMIDGATRFQRVIHIDFPTILPTASIMLILAVGNIMNVGYEKVLLMQNNLNMNYSEIISTYTYKVGLASGIPNFSLSTAIGMFNSLVNFTLLMLTNFLSKKINGSGIF